MNDSAEALSRVRDGHHDHEIAHTAAQGAPGGTAPGTGAHGTALRPLSVPEREELARLRRQDAEKNKRIRELEMERDVLKRCMVLWVK
ncbi:hypothetical protein GCM10018966_099920 [Streptomyces yanii]